MFSISIHRIAFILSAVSLFAQENPAHFVQGRVLISGGGNPAANAEVNYVCAGSRQTAFADARGYFTMISGDSRAAVPSAQWATSRSGFPGICQLTISLPRCRAKVIDLDRLELSGAVNLGTVLLTAIGQTSASTVSAEQLRIPDRVLSLFNKARRARLKGKFADAERFISTALRKAPDFVDGWFELGRIHQARGEQEQARAAFAHFADLHK